MAEQATVIYHADCPDGFTGGWLMHRWLSRQGKLVRMHPGKYGTTPPDVHESDVYVVDFCYEPEHLETMHKQAVTLTVLDHHQTALGWCQDFWGSAVVQKWDSELIKTNDIAVLDQNHSGAMLAMLWTGQHHKFVKFVEDRDLWRFQYKQRTEMAFAAITSRPYTLAAWDEIAEMTLDDLFDEGAAIARYRDRLIEQVLKEAYQDQCLGYPDIWMVAAPYAIGSDVAGELAKRDPERFAAYYVDKPDNIRRWGLRSTPDGLDVAELASTRGGGGHKHASGYETPR